MEQLNHFTRRGRPGAKRHQSSRFRNRVRITTSTFGAGGPFWRPIISVVCHGARWAAPRANRRGSSLKALGKQVAAGAGKPSGGHTRSARTSVSVPRWAAIVTARQCSSRSCLAVVRAETVYPWPSLTFRNTALYRRRASLLFRRPYTFYYE